MLRHVASFLQFTKTLYAFTFRSARVVNEARNVSIVSRINHTRVLSLVFIIQILQENYVFLIQFASFFLYFFIRRHFYYVLKNKCAFGNSLHSFVFPAFVFSHKGAQVDGVHSKLLIYCNLSNTRIICCTRKFFDRVARFCNKPFSS